MAENKKALKQEEDNDGAWESESLKE